MVNEDRPVGARARRRALGVTIGAAMLTVPISLPSQAIPGSGQAPETPAATPGEAPGTEADEGLYARDVVKLVNQRREAHGCRPLTVNNAISKAAYEHSKDMGTRGYFAHNTPSGVTPWTRMEQAGYAQPAAENIAMGYRTPQEVVDGWMGSPDHRENILNCSYKATGVGYYDAASVKRAITGTITDTTVNNPSTNGSTPAPSGPWWTEDFGYA